MSTHYEPIHWTPHKKVYDVILLAFVGLYLIVFVGLSYLLTPQASSITVVIRATGSLAFLLLHLILCIGPLCRLSPRYLPLLYNRRHLGVTMFLFAAIHGVVNVSYYHADGNAFVLDSVFLSNQQYGSLQHFPFQSLGALALLILLIMAATSHDFWLHTLSPRVWKRMHMLVYLAYALIVLHVALGLLQSEKSPVYVVLLSLGFSTVASMHIAAAGKDVARRRSESIANAVVNDGYVHVCSAQSIPPDRARMVMVGGQNVAVFRSGGHVFAVHNLCKHQNGPLGEGRIIDGCITCPWHGYQYRPEDGCSPPPFTEKVSTYRTKVLDGEVFLDPKPFPEGTYVEPSRI